jgi:hypothetical protein
MRWRFTFFLVLGVGVAMGLMVQVLDSVFSIRFPTILAGLASVLIIIVVLAAQKKAD